MGGHHGEVDAGVAGFDENDRLIAIPESDLHPGTLGNIGAVETISKGLYPEAF